MRRPDGRETRDEERPISDVRATRLGSVADRARRRSRRLILVWWFEVVVLAGGIAASIVIMAIRAGRGYLGAALIVLGFVGLVRKAVGVVRCVRRSESYPARHWEQERGCLPTALAITGLIAAFAALVTGGLFLDTPPNVDAATGAAVVYFVLLFGIISLFRGCFHHVRVYPYFESRVGDIHTYAEGYFLAQHLLDLDELAEAQGVTPLSTFGWNDDFQGETLIWHPSAAGLKTANALLARLEEEELARGDIAGIVGDLKRIAHALDRADRSGIRFCLLLQHGDATNAMEHEQRKGTFF